MCFFAPAAAAASLLSREKEILSTDRRAQTEAGKAVRKWDGGGAASAPCLLFLSLLFLLPLSNVVFAACEMCFCFDFGRSRGEEGDGAGVKGTRIWKRKKRWRQEEEVVYTGGFFFTSTAAACTPPRRGGTSALLLVSFPASLLFTEN